MSADIARIALLQRELLELTQIALRAGGAPAERTRQAMQQYVDAGVEQVNVKQVLALLSPTWPDGNYCAEGGVSDGR